MSCGCRLRSWQEGGLDTLGTVVHCPRHSEASVVALEAQLAKRVCGHPQICYDMGCDTDTGGIGCIPCYEQKELQAQATALTQELETRLEARVQELEKTVALQRALLEVWKESGSSPTFVRHQAACLESYGAEVNALHAQMTALTAERDEAKRLPQLRCTQHSEMLATKCLTCIEALESTLAQCQEAVRTYGRHKKDCPMTGYPDDSFQTIPGVIDGCTCGLKDALNAR